jgi:hypothetical protein
MAVAETEIEKLVWEVLKRDVQECYIVIEWRGLSVKIGVRT